MLKSNWILGIALFTLIACELDEFSNIEEVKLEDTPEFAVPLLFANVTMEDIVGDSSEVEISVREDDVLVFNYVADERIIVADDIVEVSSFPNISNNQFLQFQNPLEFDFPQGSDQDIDSIVLSQGNFKLSYTLAADIGDTVDFYFFMEGLSLNGNPLEIRTSQVFTDNLPESNSRPYDLTNYILHPNQDGKFKVGFEARRNGVIDNSLVTNISFDLLGLDYSSVHGYFGEDQFNIMADSIDLDFLSKYTSESYAFTDPIITMNYQNAFGLPMNGVFTEFYANNKDGSQTTLSGSIFEEDIFIDYPDISKLGEYQNGSIVFTSENTNVKELIENEPEIIKFTVDGIPNPAKDESIRGFVLKDSDMRILTTLEIPLIGNLTNFVLEDTLSFTSDFDQEAVDNFESGTLHLNTLNEIPLGAAIQVYMADANYQILDSLVSNSDQIIMPAVVDASGEVTLASEHQTDIPISKNQFEKLANSTEYLISKFIVNSNKDAQNVIIKNSQKLEAQLGISLKIKL